MQTILQIYKLQEILCSTKYAKKTIIIIKPIILAITISAMAQPDKPETWIKISNSWTALTLLTIQIPKYWYLLLFFNS